MKSNRSKPLWMRTGHRPPQTRREFLASGLIGFAGALMPPSILSLLASDEAAAAIVNCSSASGAQVGTGLAPFITINLSGGASLAGNYVPMDSAGNPLQSYSNLGLGSSTANPIERVFGGAPFAGGGWSKILLGIQAKASADTISKTRFVGICAFSQFDSPGNSLNASGLLAKIGLAGTSLPILGSDNVSAYFAPPAVMYVSSTKDLSGSLGYTGALASLSSTQKQKLANAITKLSSSQAEKLVNGGVTAMRDVVSCASLKNSDLIRMGGGDVDPNANQGLQSLWGISGASAPTNPNYVMASMVYVGLNGVAGAVNLSLGGYDYHDESRETGDAADRIAGELIGKVLESASVMGKKVFVYVTTDGGNSSVTSDLPGSGWIADNSYSGMSYLFAFDPAGLPEASGFQIGSFTEAQVVDTTFVTGNDPAKATLAAVLNYLQWNKKLDLYSKTGLNVFTTAQMDQIIKFA